MFRNTKKILSILLAAMIFLSIFPTAAFASDAGENGEENLPSNPPVDPYEVVAIMIMGDTVVVKAPLEGYPAATYPAFTAIPMTRMGAAGELVPITWSVVYPGVSIDENGALTVTSDAKFGRFTITATADNGATGTRTVPVFETFPYEVDNPYLKVESSFDDYRDFWDNVKRDIQKAKDGDTVEVEIDERMEDMPWYVLDTLIEKETIDLKIFQDGSLLVHIPAGKANLFDTGEVYHYIFDLENLYYQYQNGDLKEEPVPDTSEEQSEESSETPAEEDVEHSEESSLSPPEEEPEKDSPKSEQTIVEKDEDEFPSNTKDIAIGLAAVAVVTLLFVIFRKKDISKSQTEIH